MAFWSWRPTKATRCTTTTKAINRMTPATTATNMMTPTTTPAMRLRFPRPPKLCVPRVLPRRPNFFRRPRHRPNFQDRSST